MSLVFVGAAIGSLAGSPIADAFGRRPAIALCSIVFAVSALTMMAAQSLPVLLLGRCMVGIGIGASSTTVSVYISELAKPAARGVLVSVNEVALCVGCLVAIAVGISLEDASHGWRWMLGLASVPAVIQLAGASPLFAARTTATWLMLSHMPRLLQASCSSCQRARAGWPRTAALVTPSPSSAASTLRKPPQQMMPSSACSAP